MTSLAAAAYPLAARTMPLVLAASPLVVVAACIASTTPVPVLSVPGSAVILMAMTTLMNHLSRGAGLRIEPALWQAWGGPPTTQLLRWRHPRPSVVAVQVRHRHVGQLLLGAVRLPSASDEEDHPAAADQVYEVAVRLIRGLTRDTARFPLLHHENMGYGFRRNLLGLRGFGKLASALALSCALGFAAFGVIRHSPSAMVCAGAIAAVSLAALSLWHRCGSAWVEPVAWAYADRLFEAVQILAADRTHPTADPAGAPVASIATD